MLEITELTGSNKHKKILPSLWAKDYIFAVLLFSPSKRQIFSLFSVFFSQKPRVQGFGLLLLVERKNVRLVKYIIQVQPRFSQFVI